jgi:hypothetical protein
MALDTKQTIRGFYDQAANIDFSRDFLFRVGSINIVATNYLSKPESVTTAVTMGEGDLVYVRTASLPGRNINNVEAKYMGLSFNVPGGVTYPGSGAYSLEFYCDSASILREKLLSASFLTFNDATSIGFNATPGGDSYITLHQLDKMLNVIATYTLVGASIRDVSDISYSIAEGTGNYVTFTATFAYHFWTSELPNLGITRA